MQPLKFTDFCSGIGGGRIGLENLGMTCLGFSEIDKDAELTYREFFGKDEVNYGDLMQINPNDLPNFDFMIGGFPCQTFSIIGTRCGLEDEERGQIIYGLVKTLKAKNVKYFILENVKGLINHDKGNTLKVVLKLLDDAGYRVYHKVLNSLDFGVPQMRERIYFVGVKKELVDDDFSYEFPVKYSGATQSLEECLIDSDEKLIFDDSLPAYQTFLKYLDNKYNKGKYSIDELLSKEYRVLDTRQSDLRIYEGKTPTLRRGRHGILYVRDGEFRKLSGYEALLLQKFPKEYAKRVKGKVSNQKLLQQTGNAMTSSVIEEIARNLMEVIGKKQMRTKYIKKRKKVNFSKYMNNWLYGENGYYKTFKAIGKEGDFYTAVSTSSFFGASIANHFYKLIKEEAFKKDGWLIEVGAHKGYLLCDMIQWLYTLDPTLVQTLKFGIVERQPHVQQEQLKYIEERFGSDITITHFNDIDEVEVDYAFVVANEIFDAFPCELIKDGEQAFVVDNVVEWKEADEELLEFASKHRQVKGEVAVGYEAFALHMAKGIKRCDFVSFDYGEKFVRNDFSIRVYEKHKTFPLFDEELVLADAFQKADITYDVNFGHVIDAFEEAGFTLDKYETQARALVRFGLIDILEQFAKQATQANYVREADKIKTLIAPTIMGDKFKMVHFRK